MITYNIDVLIGKHNTGPKPVIKCHDTGVNILVNLKKERRASKWRTTEEPYMIPAGATAVIKVTKPDKKYVVQDGTCQGSGVFFAPHPQTFTAVGIASAEVNIFGKDGRRITSGTFFIEVTQECVDDCTEDSQTYVDILAEQILAAIDAADRAEEAAKRAEEAGESGGGAVSPEAIQQAVDSYMEKYPIKETDPTVPEWAKQPQKPSYTAKEVGAMPKDTPIPTVPSELPNPKKLHFTGAANATYDGSEEVTVNIPSGGGSGGGNVYYFEETYTTTEPLNGYTINLPVLMREFYELHVHAIWGNIEQTFTLYLYTGAYAFIGTVPVGKDVGTHLYFTTSPVHGRMFASYNTNVIHINAYPLNPATSVNVLDTTTIRLYSHSGGLDIPTGAVFKVWGVYHK